MKQADSTARNAVIYARYSSHNQTEQSIEGQLRVCHEYAKREGFTIVGEYIDRAISGKTDDRPDFQRMISDSRKRAFQYVLVYKLDRFARNRYDSAVYKHKLKQNGVKVVSAMENIGDNPESIILEAVLEASAEYYSLELAQKIKRGMRESALKGQFCGGGIPFGYKSAGGRLVVDEAKAPFVKKVFEQYAAGVPKKQIIAELNAAGLRNRNGKPFGNTALQVALQSEKYIGILRWGDIEIENGCPALIDRETFDKVQERIKQNKREGGKNKAKMEYLLTGKVFCGYCGGTVTGVSGTGRHGDIYYYYCCRNRRLRNGCKKAHEKKDFLEWYVVEQTVLYVLTPQRMQEIAAAVVAQYDNEFNNGKVKELERQIAKLERDMDKYTEMLLDAPKSARPRIYEKIETADMQKTDLEIDLSKLRIANKIRYTEADIVAWLKLFCKGDLFDMEFRRRIIDTFINSVYLYDDRVIVFYNIRGGKQVSYIDMLDATEGFPGLDDEPEAPADSSEATDAKKKPDTVSGVRLLNDVVERGLQKANHYNRQTEWVQRVDACRRSGQKVREWCSEQGIPLSTYYSTLDELPENVPVKALEHRLPAEGLVCPECGSTMTEIGREVRRHLKLVPAKAVVVEDWYYTYACRSCEKENTETPVVKAYRELNFILSSFAMPEAATHLMVQNLSWALPCTGRNRNSNVRAFLCQGKPCPTG